MPLVTVAAYVALLLVIPLADNPQIGMDEPWGLIALLCFAHVGAGIGIRRAWVLLLPVGFCVIAFFATGAEGLSVLILTLEMPVLVCVTGVGILVGKFAGPRRGELAAIALAVAAVPAGVEVGAAFQRATGPRLPERVQHQLPKEYDGVCAGSRGARVLLRELERRPNLYLTYTFEYSDEPSETMPISVRELARVQLSTDRERCRLRQQIEKAL
jgi:hypothetical protein